MEANLNKPSKICPDLKGTLLRIFIPPGAEINLLGLIELASPGGICIILRLPFLDKKDKCHDWRGLLDAVRAAGGKVEFGD